MSSVKRNFEAPADPPVDLKSPDSNGVDLTLIRWMLSLTPGERLQVLENFINGVEEMRRGRSSI